MKNQEMPADGGKERGGKHDKKIKTRSKNRAGLQVYCSDPGSVYHAGAAFMDAY